MEIFFYVTWLVQKYKIELAEENSLKEVLGLTLQPAKSIHLQLLPREIIETDCFSMVQLSDLVEKTRKIFLQQSSRQADYCNFF